MPKSLNTELPTENLPDEDAAELERRVLTHFLTSKPEHHKPLGKNPQAKRRKREARAMAR